MADGASEQLIIFLQTEVGMTRGGGWQLVMLIVNPSRFMNIFNLDTQAKNEYYQFLVGFPSVFTFRELDSRQIAVHRPAVED